MKYKWSTVILLVSLCFGLGLYLGKAIIDIQNEYQPLKRKPSPVVMSPWKAKAKTPRRLHPVIPPAPPCDPWLDECAKRTVNVT